MNERLFKIVQRFSWRHDGLGFVIFGVGLVLFVPALILTLVSVFGTCTEAGVPVSHPSLWIWALPLDLLAAACLLPLAWYGVCHFKYDTWPDWKSDLAEAIESVDKEE